MSYVVESIDKSCSRQFRNANTALVSRFGPKLNIHLLRNLWLTEYNIHIIGGVSRPYYEGLEFESEEDYIVFMLKWS